ncbi:MAG: hypothetical protein ACFFD4_28955 [Candidatus Odinarchaeota archaeon]
MDLLSTYLILTGELTPAESLLLKKIVVSERVTRIQAKKLLRSSGWSNYDDVISSLQAKKLINVRNDLIPDWKGLKSFTSSIEAKIISIVSSFMELKKKVDTAQERAATSSVPKDFSIGDILLHFSGNTTSISENKLLQDLPLVGAIEMIEWFEEFCFIKIQKGRRSRKLTLTAEGAALRYLFLNKSSLNSANYNYLEQTLLYPRSEDWSSFVKKVNTGGDQPAWVPFLSRLFKDLGILEVSEDGKLNLVNPGHSVPFIQQPVNLEEFISGFVPVYVSNLYAVLQILPAKPSTIQKTTELGSSSVNGITKMLSKFGLTVKAREGKIWSLTKKGKRLASLPEEAFLEALKDEIIKYPIFELTAEFVKQKGGEIGFMDLAGHFRASGVSNFNPAKSLSILRLMAQTASELKEANKTGIYRLIDVKK